MKLITSILLFGSLRCISGFAPCRNRNLSRSVVSSSSLKVTDPAIKEKVAEVFANEPSYNARFDRIVTKYFPGAFSDRELLTKIVKTLSEKGINEDNTLLATSLCCDELARQLEYDLRGIYGTNFNLGGLAGFPFAGNTGFGAMAAHIPDDGYGLCVYGPHVGISADGTVGKVERSGIELVDTCCGSAVAASKYVKSITDGGAKMTPKIQDFKDYEQGAVQELILPHGKRLTDAKDRMVELPLALYDSQDMLMGEIVKTGSLKLKRGIALLGGVQINTGPNTLDYFLPMRFDFMNYRGEVTDDLLPSITN